MLETKECQEELECRENKVGRCVVKLRHAEFSEKLLSCGVNSE